MSKKLAILVLFILVICLVSAILGASTFKNEPNILAYRGDEITYSVDVGSYSNIKSGAIEFEYDPAILSITSGTWSLKKAFIKSFDDTKAQGVFAFSKGAEISGTIFSISFIVLDDAAFVENSEISCVIRLTDKTAKEETLNLTLGKVTVKCNHEYAEWQSFDSSVHCKRCKYCEDEQFDFHSFNNDCDDTCNECGYVRTITHQYSTSWSSNDDIHWHQCNLCGNAITDASLHEYDGKYDINTESHADICSICGRVSAIRTEHVLDGFSYDEDGHKKCCSICGFETEAENHTILWGKETDGNIVGKCECGYCVSKSVEKTVENGTLEIRLPVTKNTNEIVITPEIVNDVLASINNGAVDGDNCLKIVLDNVEIAYDKNALTTISQETGSNNVTIDFKTVNNWQECLNEKQLSALSTEIPGTVVFSIELATDKQVIHDLNGNTTVTVNYQPPTNWDTSKLCVYRLEDDGSKTLMASSYKDGKLSWTSNSHSYYFVTLNTDATIDEKPTISFWESFGKIMLYITAFSVALLIFSAIILSKRENDF